MQPVFTDTPIRFSPGEPDLQPEETPLDPLTYYTHHIESSDPNAEEESALALTLFGGGHKAPERASPKINTNNNNTNPITANNTNNNNTNNDDEPPKRWKGRRSFMSMPPVHNVAADTYVPHCLPAAAFAEIQRRHLKGFLTAVPTEQSVTQARDAHLENEIEIAQENQRNASSSIGGDQTEEDQGAPPPPGGYIGEGVDPMTGKPLDDHTAFIQSILGRKGPNEQDSETAARHAERVLRGGLHGNAKKKGPSVIMVNGSYMNNTNKVDDDLIVSGGSLRSLEMRTTCSACGVPLLAPTTTSSSSKQTNKPPKASNGPSSQSASIDFSSRFDKCATSVGENCLACGDGFCRQCLARVPMCHDMYPLCISKKTKTLSMMKNIMASAEENMVVDDQQGTKPTNKSNGGSGDGDEIYFSFEQQEVVPSSQTTPFSLSKQSYYYSDKEAPFRLVVANSVANSSSFGPPLSPTSTTTLTGHQSSTTTGPSNSQLLPCFGGTSTSTSSSSTGGAGGNTTAPHTININGGGEGGFGNPVYILDDTTVQKCKRFHMTVKKRGHGVNRYLLCKGSDGPAVEIKQSWACVKCRQQLQHGRVSLS